MSPAVFFTLVLLRETDLARRKKYSPEMSINEIMQEWPQTISVLIRFRMHCVGCLLSTFHNAIDAAHEHGLDVSEFLVELAKAIEKKTD